MAESDGHLSANLKACLVVPQLVARLNPKQQSQRASIAARVANMPRGGAMYRTANLQTDDAPQLPLSEQAKAKAPLTSAADAARMLNVSPRIVADARKVHEHAR